MRFIRLWFIVGLLVMAGALSTVAQSIEGRVVAWSLNVRSAPVVDDTNIIGQLQSQTFVVIEGRTEANDWLYIRTEDSTLAGWASSRFIEYDATQLASVPVGTEFTPVAQPTAGGSSAPAAPSGIPNGDLALIMETPLFHNMTTDTVYSIFARGKRLGNKPNVFMKVGDSVTAVQPFMVGFGALDYNLGQYGYLQPTIDFFSVSPGRNIPNSFVHNGVAATVGFVSGAVFDRTWSPEYCGKLVPLHCEYDILRPSVAIVLLGGQDVRLFDAGFYQMHMRQIVKDLKSFGVIPILNTFPVHNSFRYEQTIQFNTILIKIANEEKVPLINLYRALQPLPEQGTVGVNDPVHLSQGGTFFVFNGEENTYGVTLRNLITLQALDLLRTEVLQR